MIIGQAGDGVPIDDLVHHRPYARVEGGDMTGCPLLDGEYVARQNGKRLPCERLVDENAKLLEQLEGIVGRSFRTADKMACLEADNAKLRELVRDMWRAICCLVVLGDDYAGEYEDELCALEDRMCELGMETRE